MAVSRCDKGLRGFFLLFLMLAGDFRYRSVSKERLYCFCVKFVSARSFVKLSPELCVISLKAGCILSFGVNRTRGCLASFLMTTQRSCMNVQQCNTAIDDGTNEQMPSQWNWRANHSMCVLLSKCRDEFMWTMQQNINHSVAKAILLTIGYCVVMNG